jgi:calcineurin-like phosphoesterase family protein
MKRLAAALALTALAGCGGGGGAGPSNAPTAREAVVWAVGDGAADRSAARGVVARMADGRVDRLLYLGDVYEEGTAEEFTRFYGPTYGRFAKVTSPTPGNHEWPLHREGYDPYWRKALGATPASFYSLRVGGWQIVSLNSESAHGAGSAQVRWLERAVSGPGNCRIAFWHRPRYNAGTVHGDAPDIEPLWAALRGHARIVLNGHEHNMQRFARRDGITEFISGAGGRDHYGVRDRPDLRFADTEHFGALRLALEPRRARWAFVGIDGTTLDSGTIRCRTG